MTVAAWDELFAAVYPAACALCGGDASVGGDGADVDPALRGWVCPAHAFPPRPAGPRCRRCAARLSDALPDGTLCAGCRRSSPAYRSVVALGDYGDLADWVLALKHGGRRDLARPLGRWLAERWLEQEGEVTGELVVPVPLHPLRRLERGYDQALALARALADATGAEPLRALRRARWTPPQGSPGAHSRAANVREAFRAARRIDRVRGRALWLVDDVVTSGATAQACARALRRCGARDVSVLCVARVEEPAAGRGCREPPGAPGTGPLGGRH